MSVCKQIRLISQRGIADAYREPLKIGAMIFLAVFQSFLNASIYYKVGNFKFGPNYALNYENVWNLMGLDYLITTDSFIKLAFGQVQAIP